MPPRRLSYAEIADDLASRISSGEYPPGSELPSYRQIADLYDVSYSTAHAAMRELRTRGLTEGQKGRGVYVREIRRLTRHAHGRNMRSIGGSPFARDAATAELAAAWEHQSTRAEADARIAARLGVEPGDSVMRTAYRYLADGEPIQLATSWEPLAVTAGTPVEWPEDGAAVGVVARFDHIGVRIDEFTEHVTARPAAASEVDRLALPTRGAFVLVIERTYYAAGRPVETADIVFPGDRYELVYRVPVD